MLRSGESSSIIKGAGLRFSQQSHKRYSTEHDELKFHTNQAISEQESG
jgi:hypothetical protein